MIWPAIDLAVPSLLFPIRKLLFASFKNWKFVAKHKLVKFSFIFEFLAIL